MYYLNTFYFYSILGFILETGYAFIFDKDYNSGFLYGPITPIYGIGVLIIFMISKYIYIKLHIKKIYETLIIFFSCMIILSICEYLAGISLEKIFDVVFWDYSNQLLHIGKYVSIIMSLLWGVGSLAYMFIFKKLFDKVIMRIPMCITIIISLIFLVDIIYTCVTKI